MKTKILLIIVILILLVGCTQTGDKLAQTNFKQGFGELEVQFIGEEEAYQRGQLSLPLTLRNLAAYDANDVQVRIIGFDNYYVDFPLNEEYIAILEGRSLFNPAGGMEKPYFEGTLRELLPGAEYHQENYRVFVDYKSKIEFAPTVCISTAMYDTVYDGGCEVPKEEVSFDGQGGPLAVHSMKEVARQNEVEFRFTLENKGDGEVGTVTLGEARIGNDPLPCEFRGEDAKVVEFEEKQEATLICQKGFVERKSYPTTLYIELFYDYELSIPRSLTILK